MMRIATGGISHETRTFTTVPTTIGNAHSKPYQLMSFFVPQRGTGL